MWHEDTESDLDQERDHLDVAVDVVREPVEQDDRLGGRVAGVHISDVEFACGDGPRRQRGQGHRDHPMASRPATDARAASAIAVAIMAGCETGVACEAPAISVVPRDAARSAPARSTSTGMFLS